jgi:hypothetical protein
VLAATHHRAVEKKENWQRSRTKREDKNRDFDNEGFGEERPPLPTTFYQRGTLIRRHIVIQDAVQWKKRCIIILLIQRYRLEGRLVTGVGHRRCQIRIPLKMKTTKELPLSLREKCWRPRREHH